MSKSLVRIPPERIEGIILLIRGERVILDADLAVLYGVTTTRLNEQVKRNQASESTLAKNKAKPRSFASRTDIPVCRPANKLLVSQTT